MSKYKVLLPTNGHAVGTEIEISDEQAKSYNAGEPTPRVVKVNTPEPEKPAVPAAEVLPVAPETAPEAPKTGETIPATSQSGTEANDGAGAAPAVPAAEGGTSAENNV